MSAMQATALAGIADAAGSVCRQRAKQPTTRSGKDMWVASPDSAACSLTIALELDALAAKNEPWRRLQRALQDVVGQWR